MTTTTSIKMHSDGPETITVTTWADGFGRWHAEVSTDTGWGNGPYAPSADSLKARARRAIMAELLERSPAGTVARDIHLPLHVAANRVDHMNVMRSITFAEGTMRDAMARLTQESGV